jgi:hypothetical protein
MGDGIACPRCWVVPTETVRIGRSTFCASCVAVVEELVIRHVPPLPVPAPAPVAAPATPKKG